MAKSCVCECLLLTCAYFASLAAFLAFPALASAAPGDYGCVEVSAPISYGQLSVGGSSIPIDRVTVRFLMDYPAEYSDSGTQTNWRWYGQPGYSNGAVQYSVAAESPQGAYQFPLMCDAPSYYNRHATAEIWDNSVGDAWSLDYEQSIYGDGCFAESRGRAFVGARAPSDVTTGYDLFQTVNVAAATQAEFYVFAHGQDPTLGGFLFEFGGAPDRIGSCSPTTVEEITAPLVPVQVGTQITTAANFTDPGVLDTHTAVWSWGDGAISTGIVTETNGSGSVTGSHTYTTAGVYTVTVTVTDDDGGSGQSVFEFVVVYDPNAGFVTGGGWIDSPAGAYVPNSFLTGKANFGFVSRYRPGKIVPEGQTEFRFSVADLNFHSSNYEWLVVGGARAQYKGTGTINGTGSYKFLLTAIDGQRPGGGGVDKFRIKIWNAMTELVEYDNKLGADDFGNDATELGGGSIVIHTN